MKPLVLLALLFPAAAFALTGELPTEAALPDDAAPRVIVPAVTHIDFDNQHVNATVDGPSYGYVVVPGRLTFPSMAKVRVNFDDEMIRSVDLVK